MFPICNVSFNLKKDRFLYSHPFDFLSIFYCILVLYIFKTQIILFNNNLKITPLTLFFYGISYSFSNGPIVLMNHSSQINDHGFRTSQGAYHRSDLPIDIYFFPTLKIVHRGVSRGLMCLPESLIDGGARVVGALPIPLT